MRSAYAEAVASWERHLRSGGTTPWSLWREADDRPPGERRFPPPDAVHLELARRLNLRAGSSDDTAALVELVLRTPSPGRGAVDVPLEWPGAEPRFGSPAVDPEHLPADELIRLAVGVLARLLPRLPQVHPDEPSRRWPLPWRRRFRVHGTPGTAAAVRTMVLARGGVESDWRPTHLVVARPVEVMMAEHWAAAARAGGILKWSTLWRRAMAAGRLPGALDVAALADRLSGRPGEPVHVLVARDAQHVGALAAQVLGVRETSLESSGDLAEADLLRRLNRLLALTSGPDEVHGLVARLVVHVLDRLERGSGAAPPAVPLAARDWAVETATSLAERLREGGYSVHGDTAALGPTDAAGLTGRIDSTPTLELALGACVGSWQQQEGHPPR